MKEYSGFHRKAIKERQQQLALAFPELYRNSYRSVDATATGGSNAAGGAAGGATGDSGPTSSIYLQSTGKSPLAVSGADVVQASITGASGDRVSGERDQSPATPINRPDLQDVVPGRSSLQPNHLLTNGSELSLQGIAVVDDASSDDAVTTCIADLRLTEAIADNMIENCIGFVDGVGVCAAHLLLFHVYHTAAAAAYRSGRLLV